ncbi:SUMF1/EgtB/PvdO family nonheme iron enzyme [Bradyrhizobium sp. STM 3557]|uniref:SUMF1/EgtB/PvdO family nonheme iron enzyme n=1 Tax=Bradyrhizobium sp. STM 3557 TaxID=578920 RepID=UPI00388D7C6B
MLLAFKFKLALACAAGLAGPLAMTPLVGGIATGPSDVAGAPALIELAPRSFTYRPAGDFTRAGRPATPRLLTTHLERPLAIMRHQVSAADYQACVEDRACRPLQSDVAVALDRPAVQVSWHDATAYAAWLSQRTGETYRLPSDVEWAFAAGSRLRDDGLAADADDPSRRWIARYERETATEADSATRSFGAFGVNENGVADLAGNVWEWTSTCFDRSELDETGTIIRTRPNCGVRLAEGAHRAYVTDFIRDARAGGCASGAPPANLGFRLVREQPSWKGRIARKIGKSLSFAQL